MCELELKRNMSYVFNKLHLQKARLFCFLLILHCEITKLLFSLINRPFSYWRIPKFAVDLHLSEVLFFSSPWHPAAIMLCIGQSTLFCCSFFYVLDQPCKTSQTMLTPSLLKYSEWYTLWPTSFSCKIVNDGSNRGARNSSGSLDVSSVVSCLYVLISRIAKCTESSVLVLQ